MSSSIWESQSEIQSKLGEEKNSNQTLPLIKRSSRIQQKQKSSLTFHNSSSRLDTSLSKASINKNEIIKPRISKQKLTFVSLHCKAKQRTMIIRNKLEDELQNIQFSSLIFKIESMLLKQCNIKQDQQYDKKFKKTLKNYQYSIKTDHLILSDHPQKIIKKQLQQILRVFRLSNNTPRYTQQRDNISFHKKKQTCSNISNSDKISSGHDIQHDKYNLLNQCLAFQKSQRHLSLKSFVLRIVHHHLTTELAIQVGNLNVALLNLYFCQYYARRINFNVYIIPCLILQAEIKQSLFLYDEAINILKTSLEFAVVKKYKDLEYRILEKISMIYYYRGNSYMSMYYKQLSEKGLSQKQSDIYSKQYSHDQQIKSLQSKLFSLPMSNYNKRKNNDRFQYDLNRDLIQDHDTFIKRHHHSVSQMLRSSKTSKIGTKLRAMILENQEKGSVLKFDSENQGEVLPRFQSFSYPLDHCSHVIKTHLSKARIAVGGSQLKVANFQKSLNFIRNLYSQICYQLIYQFGEDKENM